jgi:hypothetical protein
MYFNNSADAHLLWIIPLSLAGVFISKTSFSLFLLNPLDSERVKNKCNKTSSNYVSFYSP